MECVVGQPVSGDNLFGREYELKDLWERLETGSHVLMTAPRRVGKTSLMTELERDPKPGWTVVYVDVEACTDAQSCITEIVGKLLRKPKIKKYFKRTQFSEPFLKILARLEALDYKAGSVNVKLEPGSSSYWIRYANRVLGCMQEMANDNIKLLIIIDELPIAIAQIASGENGADEAKLFLSWYRKLRQNPQLQRKISTLVGGSIGFHGVLRGLNASKQINDFSPFPLDSWSTTTATQFLQQLGISQGFVIHDHYIEEMLNLLEDPVPYHVQLFYLELRRVCRNDSNVNSTETIQQCFRNQLVENNKRALVEQFLEKLPLVFDTQEVKSAQRILDILSEKPEGVEIMRLVDQTKCQRMEVSKIVEELKREGDLDWIDNHARFRSGFARESWRKHKGGR